MLFKASKCRYLEIKTQILNTCVILIFWSYTQMSSVNNKRMEFVLLFQYLWRRLWFNVYIMYCHAPTTIHSFRPVCMTAKQPLLQFPCSVFQLILVSQLYLHKCFGSLMQTAADRQLSPGVARQAVRTVPHQNEPISIWKRYETFHNCWMYSSWAWDLSTIMKYVSCSWSLRVKISLSLYVDIQLYSKWQLPHLSQCYPVPFPPVLPAGLAALQEVPPPCSFNPTKECLHFKFRKLTFMTKKRNYIQQTGSEKVMSITSTSSAKHGSLVLAATQTDGQMTEVAQMQADNNK